MLAIFHIPVSYYIAILLYNEFVCFWFTHCLHTGELAGKLYFLHWLNDVRKFVYFICKSSSTRYHHIR